MAWLLPVAGPDVCEHWGEMLGRMPLIPSSPVDGDQGQNVGFERQLLDSRPSDRVSAAHVDR